MPFRLPVNTLQETAWIGAWLGKHAEKGDVILFSGDLGAGKTTLTQSIAQGLGVSPEQYVTSPSFALMHEYFGRFPLYHMDFYRLSGEDDIEGAGLLEYIGKEGLAVIEWADRLGSFCPDTRLEIDIAVTGETERLLTFVPKGAAWNKKIEKMIREFS
jgi:tRNA threonylcarbamoyladenosine biosynthesis protein TsaE